MQPKPLAGQTCQDVPSHMGVSGAGGAVTLLMQVCIIRRRKWREGTGGMETKKLKRKKREPGERGKKGQREKGKEERKCGGGAEEKWGRRTSETLFL